MANAASLTNFGSPSLDIGDWLYSIYPRSAPGYLPLNDAATTYLASSYPTLFGLLNDTYKIVPVTTAATNPPALGQTRSVAYGNSVWCLPNYSGNATDWRTSTDGSTWTSRTGPSTNTRAIAFGAGLFAVCEFGSNAVYTSPDGITWTTRTTFAANQISTEAMIFANGQFLAMGQGGVGPNTTANTSPDGITWTARTVPALAGYENIAFGNSIYVATGGTLWSGSNTIYATSPDGITWTSRSLPATMIVAGLVFANGKFWMLGTASGTTIYSSTDGITWTTNTISSIGTPRALAFGGGVYVATSSTGVISVSTDGLIWLTGKGTISIPYRISYGPTGVFVSVDNGLNPVKIAAAVSTTQFTLPVVTALTNTFTYVKAT